MSSTMAFVRFLSLLIRDKEIGPRVVPIVPDEARTFGMEGFLDKWAFTHHQANFMSLKILTK